MRERPILFSGPMVRAILAGTKTQTRRVLKEQPDSVWGRGVALPGNMLGVRSDAYHVHARVAGQDRYIYCPYGVPGDRLWVRETWRASAREGGGFLVEHPCTGASIVDPETLTGKRRGPFERAAGLYPRWRPGRFMPREAASILMQVTEVRVQRLQDISEEDAEAEGVQWGPYRGHDHGSARTSFQALWNEINRKRSPWHSNPWVWAISFNRIT